MNIEISIEIQVNWYNWCLNSEANALELQEHFGKYFLEETYRLETKLPIYQLTVCLKMCKKLPLWFS